MNINLQKILFGLLFLFSIIALIINNSKLQQKIVTNYFNQVAIENNTIIQLEDFDYDILSGNFYTDFFLLDVNKLDTLLKIPALSLKLSLFDIVFSESLDINQIIIDSPKFDITKKSNKNKNSIFTILPKINSLDRDIFISEITLHNTTLFGSPSETVKLLNLKNIKINQRNISIKDILIQQDNSFIQTNLLYRDSILFLTVDSSVIDLQNNIFKSYSQYIQDSTFNINSIAFSGEGQFHHDSIYFRTRISAGNSDLNINVTKYNHDISVDLKHVNFDLEDFNFLPKKSFLPKHINFEGFCFLKNFGLSNTTLQGDLSMDYGDITYLFELDSLDKSNILIEFNDFNIGQLINKHSIGKTNALASLSFIGQKVDSFLLDVSNLSYNGYNYNNIFLNGQLSEEKGNVSVKISDQNIDVYASVYMKKKNNYDSWYSPIISNINGQVYHANLYNLKIPVNQSLDFISTKFVVNEINNDSSNAIIKLNDFSYQLDNQIKFIDYLDFNFNNISSSSVGFNLKSSIGVVNTSFENKDNKLFNFKCDANLSKASAISDILLNQFEFDDSLEMSVVYDKFHLSHFVFKSPQINYLNTRFFDLDISSQGSKYPEITCLIDKVIFSDQISLNDLSLIVDIQTKKNGKYYLNYYSELANKIQGEISGDITVQKDDVMFGFDHKSFVNFSNKAWLIDSVSKIVLDKQGLAFQQFAINLDKEFLIIDGYLNKNSNLNFAFQQFSLNHVNPFLPNPLITFDGVLRGEVFYNKSLFPSFAGDFEVADFTFNNISLGKLHLKNSFNNNNDSLYTYGFISNQEEIMRFEAQYPFDGSNYINADISLNNFPSSILDALIKPISNFSGNVNGTIAMNGLINNYNLLGKLKTNDLSFNLPYLQQTYFNNIDTLETIFTNDSIIIQDFTLYDNKYNTEAVFSGNMKHRALKDIVYQLFIQTDSLFVLNTSELDNENYYGKGFLGGSMMINGGNDKVTLNIDAEAKDGSVLMIPLKKSKDIKENQFIQFSSNNNLQGKELLNSNKSKFNMNFNLDVQNNSQIQLIFDEEVGDLIKGYGQGSLYLKINDLGDFEVFGDFVIEDGNYLFTLQDVITKSFQIEKGGLIRFNGHPNKAIIDLDVLYNVQASLNPLNSDYDRQVKSPVICGMIMSKDLLNPEIDFFIEIPNSDQVIETSLETLTNTDQKLLEQFLYLLIANSFLIENDPSIDYLGNTLATTGTELLSNQLSNWLSQTTDAFDLGFKWVPGTGDSLSYQQVELAVSRKFLDDRVTVNGNVGTPPEQSQADIIGDLDIEYNFFKDGRLKLRVFNRAEDYDPLSESLGYEQGFGIFFKKRFNSFKELLQRNHKKNK